MHTDWLHQVIATRPLTTPQDPVKAPLTRDLTLSRTEGGGEGGSGTRQLIYEQNTAECKEFWQETHVCLKGPSAALQD